MEPRLAFTHIDDVPWQEVRAQQHGDRRVSVHEKFLDWVPKWLILYARYDPGMIVERHGHRSDHILLITKGDVMIGDRHCTAGTMIVLEKGATFGPLIAGPEGTEWFEIFLGDPSAVPADKAEFEALLRSKGVTPLPNPLFERPPSAM